MSKTQTNTATPLRIHWLICFAAILGLMVYNVACHLWLQDHRLALDESQRILIRSIFYLLAIALFPFTKLVRHILLRLNQTMPGDDSSRARYLKTIIVTQALIGINGLFGLVMFYLGDDYNTLYIFSLLAAVGLALHRPQADEYAAIVHSRRVD
ncbi:MAG: hypothetical protein KGZ80_02110 [Methylomonas sp.]|nr:hypothetical protein [Methylomonas sp.]PPD22092.1 MAG: hypothetical protein CTY23_03295 [Methylomonas sp.]PPD25500.1 MAG: hypothetical protein CTY22_08435 [Methylomonas sp.]PPD36296.1 MAG: hypothetical protein CTY21_08440 [Methylomonas sp.]PPD42421.1 MAG: hypothetical protein CTY17_01375 [Methylomonas sp.]